MDFVDRSFIARAASRLERFRERGDDYNFRCPFCGDSKKSEDKARAWLLWNSQERRYRYSCYNCSIPGVGLKELLLKLSPPLHEEYVAAKFKSARTRSLEDDRDTRAAVTAKPVFAKKTGERLPSPVDTPVDSNSPAVVASRRPFTQFPGVVSVWESEWALEYLASRRIPIQALDDMYVADPLTELSGRIEAYAHLKFQRMKGIVFPYYGPDGSVAYMQTRTTSEDLRYMTFEVGGGGKLWGRHHIKTDKRAFMFEGVLDAVMIENGLASGGVDLIRAAKIVRDEYPDTPLALVYDSDWHTNEQVYWQVARAVDSGFDVVFANGPGKDVNEMVKTGGWSCEQVQAMLDGNIKSGLSAKLAIAEVKKPWSRRKLEREAVKKGFPELKRRM